MLRAVSVLLGFLCVLPAPLVSQRGSRDADAAEFALAYRAGHADQFRNRQIAGAGMSFHGLVTERLADGSTRASLVITLGSVRDGRLSPIATREDFLAAERARTTLVVALSGPDLPPPPSAAPALYEFAGVYDGQVRTIARSPQGSDQAAATADAGPCPGEKPTGESQAGSFYCAPLLTGATATIRR